MVRAQLPTRFTNLQVLPAALEGAAKTSPPAAATAATPASRATGAHATIPAAAAAPAKPADGYARFYQPLLDVDGAHSTIAFAVPFMGLSRTDGRFTAFEGAVWFDPAAPASAAVTISIDAKSIDTANKMRDDDLRGPQFFDVEKFPRITFRSNRVAQRGHGGKLDAPWGNLRAACEGTLPLHRADFGIAGNGRFAELADFAIGPDVDVTLRIQAVRYNVAKWTTGPKSVVPTLLPIAESKGAAAAIAEYRRMKKDEGERWVFPEGALSLLGHRLIQSHHHADGLAMLVLNAEVFPDSAHVWEDVAVAKAVSGDLAGALEAARRSQSIDAGNPTVLELLRKLEPAKTGG